MGSHQYVDLEATNYDGEWLRVYNLQIYWIVQCFIAADGSAVK